MKNSRRKRRLRLELAQVLREYGGITILVTHDRDEVYQLCDYLLLAEKGQVLESGLPMTGQGWCPDGFGWSRHRFCCCRIPLGEMKRRQKEKTSL